MRAVDTNLLVRAFVQDDPAQSTAARRVVADAIAHKESLWISLVVVCEFVWTLSAGYKKGKAAISGALQLLVDTEPWMFEEPEQMERALSLWRTGRADLADYLIGEASSAAGCRDTVTFDKSLRGVKGFTVLR